MNSLSKILRSTASLWPYYLGVIFTSVVTALLALASPLMFKKATDTIVAAVTGDLATPDAVRRIVILGLILFAADLGHTLMTNIGGYIGDVMGSRMRQILSTRYFAKLLILPQSYFDNQVTGAIIARLDRSISSVTQFLQSFSNNFFPMLVTVAAVLAISAWYYWPLALLLAALFPLYLWLTALTSRRWQRYEGTKNALLDSSGGRFAEVIGQIKVTRSFVAEARELDTFGHQYGRMVAVTRKQSGFWHRMDTLRGAALNLIFLAIYLLLFWRTLAGHFSLGDMVMLLQLVNMAKQPVFMASWIIDTAQRAIAGSRDYFAVMAAPEEDTANRQLVAATHASGVPDLSVASPAPLHPQPDSPVISFDDVSFSYEEGKQVLSHMTFAVERGHRVALVGESGGGKSTVVNLLLGLYRPDSGTLTVCGEDVETLGSERLRASVGVVFQEPQLFSGTIRSNIAYGLPDATDAQIEDVARRANAHGFITSFPQGYDTVIGERGLRLSGGQKQRIAIARAMLKDAPILILDEATSALDNRSERAVQVGLDQLMADRTTLMIAHRLSTIASVDTIITLDQGRIDEIGSPAQLAQSGGIYSQLLALTASSSAADRKRLAAFGFHEPSAGGGGVDKHDEHGGDEDE
ncbi:ABC transporter ATP-binding protein [Corynebacterium uberis]|uniref:ABC transporter ATP-binding protein n=1 Tax=Corynebacterium TaxID=1716 RepID=UPI001D0A46B9|nr:ABC transporter ATP-binding protein [Corynebacterium uberis]MCZ9308191.1 ABC transporter ATP-binding protein/permease [Corynebacterium sp. c6VSa_13]UDL73872.1 ABC transporter ATP-binding protein/permease [Corynebacterium uberis]UDL75245.1 ABC transporter ATP-binding protein/permease [Corynebacterium uberis]UDL79742.1 ABC transporter ATP-binding protein/permease [Corynebacterium uberis]UDL81873.1 ABC transporter ATP-binding protein/permease [Corynebacterium uberis]